MFPSVLRLFYHGPLRYELENLVDSEEGKAKLKKLRFVEMHRVIDNEKNTGKRGRLLDTTELSTDAFT